MMEFRAPGKKDNSQMIFLTLNENICCDLIRTVSVRRSNNGLQCMFLWNNVENYPFIIPVTPSYLEHCHSQILT